MTTKAEADYLLRYGNSMVHNSDMAHRSFEEKASAIRSRYEEIK